MCGCLGGVRILCCPLQGLLSDAKQELQELKASVRRAQREKEEQQLEKQARTSLLLMCN